MVQLDYKRLGLKIGLEIHRQLDTNKLFCKCPSRLRDDEPDIKIKRFLRPVLSEVGEVDPVAEYETRKGKYYVYEAYSDTNCLVELDAEPPGNMNKEALKIALTIAKMMHSKPIDEIQVMRKQVLDGSNTSGFQRTALIATGGFVEIKDKKIGIETICLEEDAARKIREEKNFIIYRLDRLGIPLIEVATEPAIGTPEEAKAVAEAIGDVLRSTRVKRGIGTVRQDLNMSIRGGSRVEIKGIQKLQDIPKIIENEVKRQIKLVKAKQSKPEVRAAKTDGSTRFMRPLPGAARIYPETDVPPVRTSKMFAKIKAPRTLEQMRRKFLHMGLSGELARAVVYSDRLQVFEQAINLGLNPVLVANILTKTLKELKRVEKVDISKIKDDELLELLKETKKSKIPKEAIPGILGDIARGVAVEEAIRKVRHISRQELKEIIRKVLTENREIIREERAFKKLMGPVMLEVRGRIAGKIVAEELKKEISKEIKN
jgi:Glu-tRNA(Gln) amidotransferase subunit E-like FAD-binding protein